MQSTANIRIGISGWRYKPWRGTFYPEDLVQKKELEYASRQFNSIELNGSFYSLHSPEAHQRWHDETPDDFQFSVKGSRFITHMRRLKDVEIPLANFFSQGIFRLGKKLGAFLWQFPPNFKYDRNRFEDFFELLPKTWADAADFGEKFTALPSKKTSFEIPAGFENRKLRHTIEIRNETFVSEEFIALLRRNGIGLVVADTVEWPLLMDVTQDFVYCRLHGSEQLYASGYDDEALNLWSERIVAWSRGEEVTDGRKASAKDAPKRTKRDVYVYFDNDMKVRAPFDAKKLTARIADLLKSSATSHAALPIHIPANY